MKSVNEYLDKHRGTVTTRWKDDTGRYIIDFADDFAKEGWLQYDTAQDAEYFGLWVNKKNKQILKYCEGDWTLHEYRTVEKFNLNMQSLNNYYAEGMSFAAIDTEKRVVTVHRQDRSEFLIGEDA